MVLKGQGFTNGTIILDEPEAVYYSGQWISGNVHFELHEPIQYSAINLAYLGEALVQQAEKQYVSSGGAKRCREVKYDGHEQYLNFMHCVSGGTGTLSTLPLGVHAIPFQFQVPFHAPSSLVGEVGSIAYSITAYLEYPEPGRREKLEKEFQVVAPISSNTLAKMMTPLQLDFEDIQTCQCFCAGKPVNLKISVPSAALPLGAHVPITVKTNDTYIEIYEICFRITERRRYRTQQPRSEYTTPEEVLVEMKKGPLMTDRRSAFTWVMPLPAAVLPNLESCSIIDVAYFFKVNVQLTGCKNSVEEQSEILIGVLPPSDTFAVTSPEVAAQLPKAPVPDPNNLHTGEIDPQIASTPLESAQKTPYNIGFTNPAVPTDPNPAETVHVGYVTPSDANSPYPSPPPSYNPDCLQQNVAPSVVPSAPPL